MVLWRDMWCTLERALNEYIRAIINCVFIILIQSKLTQLSNLFSGNVLVLVFFVGVFLFSVFPATIQLYIAGLPSMCCGT